MTPPPLPEDTGGPIVRPRGVTVAAALALVAGAIMLFIGVAALLTTDQAVENAVATGNERIAACNAEGIGIGPSVVIPEGDDAGRARATECAQYAEPTPELIDSFKTQSRIVAGAVALFGLAAVAAGFLLLRRPTLGRKVLIPTVVLLVMATLLLSIQNFLLLLATLFLVIAVMLTFIGRGNLYFVLLRRRGAQQ